MNYHNTGLLIGFTASFGFLFYSLHSFASGSPWVGICSLILGCAFENHFETLLRKRCS